MQGIAKDPRPQISLSISPLRALLAKIHPATMKPIVLTVLSAAVVTGFVIPSPRSPSSGDASNLYTKRRRRSSDRLSRMDAIVGAQPAVKQEWKSVLEVDEIAPGDLMPIEVNGLKLLLVAEAKDGTIYCVGNASPPLGTPLEEGEVKDGKVICPNYRTAFDLSTGEVVGEWCPFPPVIGFLTGKLSPQRPLNTFPVRQQGKMIQVQVDVMAKANFERKYWKGLLDAQGKADGGYY
ncbi:unnamed protein product [Vitrella brassicaformis CCMP3155]|uniref:Rieske domain-containing protein n=2 Tax=Vitrella brassicaformis TaxID=1169539 RepID=A0A0G4FXZ2_VITBC|nr:unnamed protein product [Vitrella brassicaformis CCMP3155]|eukprot:CEM20302.1 unnamed protein product [Vitrella brassicaformis CCMP3155]